MSLIRTTRALAGLESGNDFSIALIASASESNIIGSLAHWTERAVITLVCNAAVSIFSTNLFVVASAIPIPIALPCVSGVRSRTKILQMKGFDFLESSGVR